MEMAEAYLFKLGSEHGVAQGGLPLQLAAAVLAQVEQLEHLLQLHHLGTAGGEKKGSLRDSRNERSHREDEMAGLGI